MMHSSNIDSDVALFNDVEANFSPLLVVKEATEKLSEIKTIQDILKEALVRPTDKIAPPDRLITYNEAPICSLGDFSLVIGKAKSRKSLVISLFVAAMLSEDGLDGLASKRYQGKPRIIWIDTEQSRYHSQGALKRALKKTGLDGRDLPHVEMYCLRPFSPMERVEMINEIIVNQNPNNDIALVIIDGARDLITDINSPEQATKIVTRLMKWTESKHLHIMTVLHQNKGDANARGHVGSELVNKAQTVMSVEIAKGGKEFSNVSPEQSREQPFEPFSICFDAEGLPSIGEIIQEDKQGGRKTIDPFDFDFNEHEGFCRKAFENGSDFSRQEMLEKIRYVFSSIGKPIGDNKARQVLTYWVEENIVKNNAHNGQSGQYQRVKP